MDRELDPDDVVICDESGPVSLAGVMGGASTEIGDDTHDVLLEAAADFGADCIMVGSVGLTSAAHFVLGSVASSVAHHAPCDVLIVHTTAG